MNIDSLLIEDRKIKVAHFATTNNGENRLAKYFLKNKFPVDIQPIKQIDEVKASLFDLILYEPDGENSKVKESEIIEIGIPLVILSAKLATENILEDFRRGIFDFVIKDEEEKYFQILPHVIERAAMVRKFRSRERILSHSIEAINEALFICDADDNFVFVNQAFCKSYEYSYMDILGKNVSMIFKKRESNSELMKPRKAEEIHVKKSGKEFPVMISLSELSNNGAIIRIGISTDLTEIKLLEEQLQHSKQRLQLAQRMARLSSWEWNFAQKSVTWTNDQLIIFGVESEAEINSRTFLKKIHDEDLSVFLKSLKLLKKKKIIPAIDIRALVDNEERILNLHFTSNEDETGNVASIFITLQDITERKQLEDELSLLNKKKDRFFSIISHDLKSPFNAIVGITEILHNDFDGMSRGEVAQFIDLLSTSTKRALDLLNNLLIWSRIQLGTIRFNPEKIILSEKIKQQLEKFSTAITEKAIVVNNNLSHEIIIAADSEMLNTILGNLISNAVKFNKSGGEIKINAQDEVKMILVSIEDSGIGLTADDITKLFKIETHVTEIGEGREKGTGLGLVLCNEFIKIHGGTISVQSEPMKGSIFSFTLPKEL